MQILIIALALGVIYFLFSSLIAIVSELRSGIIRSRQKMLQWGIYEALNDEKLNTAFGNLVYYHPLLDLYRKTRNDLIEYVPSENFAKALLAIVQKYVTLIAYPLKQTTGSNSGSNVARVLNSTPEEIAKPEEKTPSIQYSLDSPFPIDTVVDYKRALTYLQPSDKRTLFESFAINAVTVSDIEKNIANWFDGYMVQKSKWYKSSKRVPLFVISLIAAILLNVDGFRLVKYLVDNPTATNTISQKADAIVKNGRPQPMDSASYTQAKDALAQFMALQLPIGWRSSVPVISDAGIGHKQFTVTNLGFFQYWSHSKYCFFKSTWESIIVFAGDDFEKKNLFWLIMGWALSAFFGSLGAPFWFDFINRFINIKRTGDVTQKGEKK